MCVHEAGGGQSGPQPHRLLLCSYSGNPRVYSRPTRGGPGGTRCPRPNLTSDWSRFAVTGGTQGLHALQPGSEGLHAFVTAEDGPILS